MATTTCYVCQPNRAFRNERALLQHTEAAHGRREVHQGVQMWEQGRQQQGELTTGASVGNTTYELDYEDFDEENGIWRCFACGKAFLSSEAYMQHLRSGVHEQKAYRCSTCNREFSSLSGLHGHAEQTGHARPARQVRTMLGDAARVQERLMLTDQSGRITGPPPPEGYLFFDGGAQPNPGVGGAGFVLMDDHFNVLSRKSIRLSTYPATNNQAEYTALIAGLTEAFREGMRRLNASGDADLVIKHMNGEYRVNSANMIPLYNKAQELVSRFLPNGVNFAHIRRDANTAADSLAREAIAGTYDFVM